MLQSMVWSIPHLCYRPTTLLLSGTSLDYPPVQRKDVGQCKLMQKLIRASMTPLLQLTKDLQRSSIPSPMWSISVGFARMVSNVVRVATKKKNENRYQPIAR